MCPNREWFSTYSSVEGGVVRMGNDSSSKVIGIGTVKIRVHDGRLGHSQMSGMYLIYKRISSP